MALKNSAVVNEGICSWFMLFDEEECLQISDWAIRHGEVSSGKVHYTSGKASTGSLRRCKEYLIDGTKIGFKDGSTVSTRVNEAFQRGNVWGLDISTVPSIRVMEYQVGDGYGKHTDWSYGAARERKVSMTVQLTSHYYYKGGGLVLYAGPAGYKIQRAQGTAAVWPSWTLHEVLPVESGVRYSLTAWAHGSPYK